MVYALEEERYLSDDLYWQILEEAFPSFSNPENENQTIDSLVRLARLTPSSKVLNVDCGTGKHSVALAKRGYSVSGCDSRAWYLTSAKENAALHEIDVHWSHQALQSIHFQPCSFDLITLLSCTFSYLRKPEDDFFLLQKIYSFLSPHGVFVMETIGREALEANFQQKGWVSLPNGALLLWERKIIHELSWLNEALTLIQDHEKRSCFGGVRMFYTLQILQMLERVGFVNVKLYEDLQGSPYSTNSPQLIIVAEKCTEKTVFMRG